MATILLNGVDVPLEPMDLIPRNTGHTFLAIAKSRKQPVDMVGVHNEAIIPKNHGPVRLRTYYRGWICLPGTPKRTSECYPSAVDSWKKFNVSRETSQGGGE